MQSREVLVSIFCCCYNQENYIEDTLKGIVEQKTSFKFEAIIIDDCSNDSTQDIIKEYQMKYPDIIIPIFNETNQYSKGKDHYFDNFIHKARGKYVAVCEGDDYWIDNGKLQIQYEFLETHPDYSAVVHDVIVVRNNGTEILRFRKANTGDIDMDFSDVILKGNNVPTCSYFYRISSMERVSFIKEAPVGDYPSLIILASKGKIRYMSRAMAAYRFNSVGSWSSKVNLNEQNRIEINKKLIHLLDVVDEYYVFAHHDVILEKKRNIEVYNSLLSNDINKVKELRLDMSGIEEKNLVFGLRFPNIYYLLHRFRSLYRVLKSRILY